MADTAIERPEENEELQRLSRELSQELALRDSLIFKKEKLLAGEQRYIDEKADSLRNDYQTLVDDINQTSARNMAKEVDAMSVFSTAVDEFNGQCGDFLLELARLKKIAGEVK